MGFIQIENTAPWGNVGSSESANTAPWGIVGSPTRHAGKKPYASCRFAVGTVAFGVP